MSKVVIGGTYRHFKDKLYLVKDLAIDCETLEPVVVYQALYGEEKVWVRKLSDFTTRIDRNREGNITNQSSRFELLPNNQGEM